MIQLIGEWRRGRGRRERERERTGERERENKNNREKEKRERERKGGEKETMVAIWPFLKLLAEKKLFYLHES